MIIDSHAHIYPDKLARKAARSIGDFYDIDMDLDGTVDMLLKVGDEAGVDKFLVHSGRDDTAPGALNKFIHCKERIGAPRPIHRLCDAPPRMRRRDTGNR